jgi:uncharacterized protein with PIN domain
LKDDGKELRFLADGMLGKLTRWLRMLGCDVLYQKDLGDDELVKIAAEENRVLLTRDAQLFGRAHKNNVQAYLVRSRTETEKLAETAQQFSLKLEIDASYSRCPKCNAMLEPVPKGEVDDKVPQATLQMQSEFWKCAGCGQIYWHGSHWQKILRTLHDAKALLKPETESTI